MDQFIDRHEAGKFLAQQLQRFKNDSNTMVLALPRGGVPVAYEIAHDLHLPLDVFIVRKLGVPWHKELAMGAMAMDNTLVFNQEIIDQLNIAQSAINTVIANERMEIQQRSSIYRGDRPFPNLENKTVILVDDGIATGATIRAAILALQSIKPSKIIVAVPVASTESCQDLAVKVDEIVCPLQSDNFIAVGKWYLDFQQTSDEEVRDYLKKNRSEQEAYHD